MPLGAPALSAGEVGGSSGGWIDEGSRATPASAAAKPKWEAAVYRWQTPAIPPVVWKKLARAPIDRFVSAYSSRSGSEGARTVVRRRSSPAARISIFKDCCRLPILSALSSPIADPQQASAPLSNRCSPRTRNTLKTGSPSGTTCCATTKASITTPKRPHGKASRRGCCPPSNRTCPIISSSRSC